MKSKYSVMFILLFIYLFFLLDTGFHGPDEPIYFAYTASIVEDGDLNVLNQAYPTSHPPIVSQTFNLPDFHNHGGVVLWVPFYLYAKIINYLSSQLNIQALSNYGFDNIARAILSLSTLIFGFLSLLISYLLSRMFFSKRNSLWSMLALLAGTPFFYYLLLETGNANIVATLFSALSIWFLSYALSMKRLHWFFYGVFFSICITVKVELWSQMFFIIPFFIFLALNKKTNWVNSAYFLYGIIPVLALRAINAYFKFGTLHIEELFYLSSALRYAHTYCFNGLFGSYRGIFYTSPIFYICFIGFVPLLLNKHKKIQDIFLLILALSTVIKLFFIGRIFSPGGDTLSARIIFTELPIFILLLAGVFQLRNKYLKSVLIIGSIFCIIWNLLIIAEYRAGLDWLYIPGLPTFLERIGSLKYIGDILFYAGNLTLKLKLLVPMILLISGVLIFLRLLGLRLSVQTLRRFIERLGSEPLKNFSLFVFYLFIAYSAITLLNILNNKTNVGRLRKHKFYTNIQVKDFSPVKMTELEEDEHLWMLSEMQRYYILKGQPQMADYIEKSRKKIFANRESIRLHFYQPVRPYHSLAASYTTIHRYEKAIEAYRDALRINHNDFDAFLNLGYLYSTVGDYAKAIAAFARASALRPDSLDACFRLAEAYNRAENFPKAIEYYRKYLQLNPASFSACCLLGDNYQAQKDSLQAIACYEQALKLKPDLAEAYSKIGSIYLSEENYVKAADYYTKAIKFDSTSAGAAIALGNIYYLQKEYSQAITYLIKATYLDHFSVEPYSALAAIYQAQGDYPKAIAALEKVLQLNPHVVDTYNSLAVIYQAQGDYPKAIDCYQKYLQLRPNSIEAHILLGNIYQGQGNYTKALEYFNKAIQINPSSVDAYSALGSVYQAKAEYVKALESYQKLLQLKPTAVEPYSALAAIYQAQGDYPKAIAALEKVLQLNPDFIDAHSNLGNIYNLQGDYDNAISHLHQYLRFRPGSVDTYSALVEAYKNKGNKQAALEQIQKLRELGRKNLAEELEQALAI